MRIYGAINLFRNAERNDVIHKRLWELLLDYYFVGGNLFCSNLPY